MNKIIILTSLLLISFIGSLAAQNVGFSYQAVALDRSKAEGFGRDTEGEVLSSRNISVRFSISEGSIEGPNVYQETHETTTDVFGMFRLIVGRGQQMGNKAIDALNWGNTAYFLHVEIDLNGQFEYLGAEELLGSPYALNVKNQTLELTGNQLSISEGNSVNLADNDATNELQTLSKEGNELILSNGGGRVTMETGGAGNQTLTRAGNEISLSNNGGTVSIDDEDSDVTNEIQDLQLIANELRITNNSTATSIDLLKYLDDTQLSEGDLLSMLVENGYVTEGDLTNYLTANGYLTAEVDGDITNEIQDLQLSGDDLVITNNGSATTLDLSKYLDDTQISEADLLNLLVSNGYITQTELNTYLTSNGYLNAEVDGSVTNEIQDLQLTGNNLSITNNGSATTLDLSKYLDDTQISEADLLNLLVSNGYITQTELNTYLTSNGYLTAEVDGSVTNEIQDLQLSGNNLTITNNGTATTIDLSAYLDDTDTQLTEAEVDAFANNNGYLTAENNAFATTSGVTSNAPGTIATDDFVFGSTSLDDIAGTDDDNRMFFDKSKGAFRAGIASNPTWEDNLVGTGSFASGENTTAYGNNSVATGQLTSAFGNNSFATGYYTTANDNSFATGFYSEASGINSFASGYMSAAVDNSFATGYIARSTGENSFSSGYFTQASGVNSFAAGFYSEATGMASFASGFETTAPSSSEAVFGSFNTAYTPADAVNFNSGDRLFVLGNGTADASRSDALIMLKSGATTLNGALTIDADNVGGSDGYTLPGQDGANGQVMITDGSGVVSWSSAASSGGFATASNITSNSPGAIATDDFVFGSTSLDDIAGTDDDNRMFFDKSKGAFRAGTASGTNWDEANIGDYSFAAGLARASGSGSFATGAGIATGANSFASGAQTTASGNNSFASGLQTIATGTFSFSVGFLTEASGAYSFALGNRARASANGAFAIGQNTTASGGNSFAGGTFAIASGSHSFTYGRYTNAYSSSEAVFGSYNTAYSPSDAVNFHSSDRLFVLGNGTSGSARADALIILKSGATTLNGALSIDADNVGGSDGYTLPGQDGSHGQVMTTDGSGVVSWLTTSFATASNITSNSNGTIATDDFVFGSTSLNDIAGTDDDNRMFFDKSKGAFRAGTAASINWDEANIGDYSFASGSGWANGAYSFASGLSTQAFGDYSSAWGGSTYAGGDYSAAWGGGTNASGDHSTAWGMSTTASGDRSTAWGIFTTASGRRSTAWGFSTVAMGSRSTAWGSQTEARASNSTAWGDNTQANGGNSTAWGDNTRANGNNSTAWGQETSAPSISETALGQYSTSYVPTGGNNTWNVADRLLTIGNGVDDISRSDALIILKNGDAKLAGTLTQNSDSRLKKDIAPLNNSLSSITQLQGVHYKWNDVKPHDMESLQTGLIAQEVEKILPDLVSEGSDGYKSVNYIALVPHLIEAIKALQQKNEALKAESQLKDELMDARMAALEAMMAELKAAKTE